MTVYSTSAISARVSWPEPIETIWQVLPYHSQSLPSWKRTDLGLSERLFIGAMLSIPKDQRPWGSMNWLAETMQVSRPTLYAIGEWTKAVLLSRPDSETITQEPAFSEEQKTVVVTTNRVKRTALTLALPGGVPDRPAEICLRTAFDEGCSPRACRPCRTRRADGPGRSCKRSITLFWARWCKPEMNCLWVEIRSC